MNKTTNVEIGLDIAGYMKVDGETVLLLTNGATFTSDKGFVEGIINYAEKNGSPLPMYEKIDGKFVRATESDEE